MIKLGNEFKNLKQYPFENNINRIVNNDDNLTKRVEFLSNYLNPKPLSHDYIMKLSNLLKLKEKNYAVKRKLLIDTTKNNQFKSNRNHNFTFITRNQTIESNDTLNLSIKQTFSLPGITICAENEQKLDYERLNTIGNLSKVDSKYKYESLSGVPEFQKDYLKLTSRKNHSENSYEEYKQEQSEDSDIINFDNVDKEIIIKMIRKKEKFVENCIKKINLENKSKISKKINIDFENIPKIHEMKQVQLIKKITQKMKILNTIDKTNPPITISEKKKLKIPHRVINFFK